MKRKIISLFSLLLFMFCILCSVTASAKTQGFDIRPVDFGDQNDYDIGGYDSYDYGGGYDYDDYDYDDDYSDNNSYSFGGTSSSDSDFTGGDWICAGVLVITIVAVIIAVSKIKKKGGYIPQQGRTTRPMYPAAPVTLPNRTAEIVEAVHGEDPNFDPEEFVSFAKFVYITIQDAWSKRDLAPVRLYLHDNLYNQTNNQVAAKIQRGITPHCENVAVGTAYLTGYKRNANFETLTVYLSARLTDYETDATGKVVRGNPQTRYEMKYALKFIRNRGVKTNEVNSDLKAHNCPNCGAPLEMSNSGKCEYCDSVITTGEYTWVLYDYSSIRPDTQDEGISITD